MPIRLNEENGGKLELGTNIMDASGFGDTKHHETAQLAASCERMPFPAFTTSSLPEV